VPRPFTGGGGGTFITHDELPPLWMRLLSDATGGIVQGAPSISGTASVRLRATGAVTAGAGIVGQAKQIIAATGNVCAPAPLLAGTGGVRRRQVALPADPQTWPSYLAAVTMIDEDLADLLRREMELVAA
jgi:hypothetical protein